MIGTSNSDNIKGAGKGIPLFYHIGNFVSYMTKPSGGCAARGEEITALQSARARRVRRRTLFIIKRTVMRVVNKKAAYTIRRGKAKERCHERFVSGAGYRSRDSV